jgi:hypothetical protein
MLNKFPLTDEIIKNKSLTRKLLIIFAFLLIVSSTIATANAHILIIGDSINDLPNERQETMSIYQKLVSDGYPVVLLLGKNATAENIIKRMYGADAMIYVGHGSDLGLYDGEGGISNPPYSIPTIDDVGIWTSKNYLSEGLSLFGLNLQAKFIPPLKKGASVIFVHTCFTTGWVKDTVVTNPDETIYNFNIPYVNSGANVYSSGYYQAYDGGYFDGVLGQELANGGENSLTFREANNLANSDDKIDTSYYKEYNNMTYYTSDNNGSLFIGNLDSNVLPPASDCSEYDSKAANLWYNSGKPTDDSIYDESVKQDMKSDLSLEDFDDFISGFFEYLKDDFFDF